MRDERLASALILDDRGASRFKRRRINVEESQRFMRVRRAEHGYARHLRAVAHQVGLIIEGLAPGGLVRNIHELTAYLDRYSELIGPWARAVASRMLAEVDRRDYKAWHSLGRKMGRALRTEIATAPTGEIMRALLDEQVVLIKSLPIEAAQRVHQLNLESIVTSGRANEIAKEIMLSGHVTKSRANLIARTETTRTATSLLEARCLHIGSESYIWRTAEDEDVRELHRKLNGRVFKWKEPPVAGSNGERANPGAIYNCRCYAEPIIV